MINASKQIEEETQLARYYAQQACFEANPEFNDDPPTPPKVRRSRRAAEAARQAEAEAQQAAAQEEADRQEEELCQAAFQMDHDAQID